MTIGISHQTDWLNEVRSLCHNLNQKISASAYDTAWVAKILATTDQQYQLKHFALQWLLENQLPDGSWGGQIFYPHDRLVSTLAAILALLENGYTPESPFAIEATNFLIETSHLLQFEQYCDLVGFELIFTMLLNRAKALGLLPNIDNSHYEAVRHEKLSLIPQDALYAKNLSIAHSLEFLDRDVNPESLKCALNQGSLGNSPAATSFYLRFFPNDQQSINYLQSVAAHHQFIPCLHPFRTFELAWVLNNFSYCRVTMASLVHSVPWEALYQELTPAGISLDATFGALDCDITAVTLKLLSQAGYTVSPTILANFECPNTHTFFTYAYEREQSITVNAHALEAIHKLLDYPNREAVAQAIIHLLISRQSSAEYWCDKWHISPYYATFHTIAAVIDSYIDFPSTNLEAAMNWLLSSQRKDGSWGFFNTGTLEETAYGLSTLLFLERKFYIDPYCLKRAFEYIIQNYRFSYQVYPELWAGKVLYTVDYIVRSTILTSLLMYSQKCDGH